jgi:peroxiredoxin
MAGCGVSAEKASVGKESDGTKPVSQRGTSIGQVAPEFDLERTDGQRISFKDLDGKPAVIVFWTAWCPVCKEEAPHINRLAAEFEPKGVTVVGINIGESDARIAEGIKDFGIKYAVAKDKDTSVSRSYKVIGTPTVVFLNSKGEVQYFGNELPKDYAEKLNASLQG